MESRFTTEAAAAAVRFSSSTRMICIVRKRRRKKVRKEEGIEEDLCLGGMGLHTCQVPLVHWPLFSVFLCKIFRVLKEFFTVL